MTTEVLPHPYQWAYQSPPIGHWATKEGTFSQMLRSEFLFLPDGTGEYNSFSTLTGTEKCRFFWKFLGVGKLQTFDFSTESEDPNFFSDGSNDPNKSKNWSEINYFPAWTSQDIDKAEPVLVSAEVDKRGNVINLLDSFWLSNLAGVSFVSNVEEALDHFKNLNRN